MEDPPLGPGGEDITWPDQVAPRGRKASSTRKIKPQTSNQMATPAGSGRGHVGVVVKSHLSAWSGFHATVGLVSVRWNHGATHA